MATVIATGNAAPTLQRRRGHMQWLLAAVCALCVRMAPAADLQVAPILLEFAPDQQAQGLWLSNSGTAPLRAQVRVQAWTQPDGEDQLAPTRELAASPPIMEIAPGARQLVRIVRLQPVPPAQELAYRLIVDELPDDAVKQDASGLQFRLRYSIPVFVLPQGTAPAPPGHRARTDISALSATLQADGATSALLVKNHGRQRVRISELAYVAANGARTPLMQGLVGYVLAGQGMQWQLPVAVPAQPGGTLKARFDNDAEEQSLPLVPALR